MPENLLDYQIDDAARQVILRMARGTEAQCVTAVGMVAAAKLGQLDEIIGGDEKTLSRTFSDFRDTFDSGVAIATAAPNPWMCAFPLRIRCSRHIGWSSGRRSPSVCFVSWCVLSKCLEAGLPVQELSAVLQSTR